MHDTFTQRALCPRCKALLPPPWPPPGGRGRCPSCGGEIRTRLPATDDTSARLIGKTLGGCRLVALVGRGAMGNVYAARQLSLDRTVAVKTIRPELCADPEMLARFQAEARTIGLFRTEHVVQVHDVGFEDGIHFIVMEFVGGGHLGQYAESFPEKRLPAIEAVRFLIQAARGLLEAEKLGIVHRDIKPGNLLLDDARRVKIADFGIAKALGGGHQTLFGSGCLVGTPIYMSPEQGRGEDIDHRSDMYSLGATFYHLATGRRPVEGDSVYEVIRWKNRTSCLSADEMAEEGEIARALSGIIAHMTAQRAGDRYRSFADVIAEAEAVAPTSCIELRPGPAPSSARTRNLLG
ncbi:MAG: serine/threonine-protein kinase, partial [Planctomycetota bacterium]